MPIALAFLVLLSLAACSSTEEGIDLTGSSEDYREQICDDTNAGAIECPD